ncbi:hypothetical protein BH11MYX1_BH11MYX1_38310 [soil metagenome]
MVLILAGLLPLIAALAVGGAIGSGATLCYLMVSFGVLGLTGMLGRFSQSPPEARVRPPSRARSR